MKAPHLAALKYFALGFLLASVLFNHPAITSRFPRNNNVAVVVRSRNHKRGRHRKHKTKTLFSSVDDEPAVRSIKSINLIGERHSGTKWITSHLQDCFGDQLTVVNRYTRWKHWFQYDDRDDKDSRNYHPPNSSLVVAMFRDPYDWVHSMQQKPYHSPMHYDLDWKAFVTKPWTMERGHGDEELLQSGEISNAECMHRFAFDEAVPCSRLDRNMYNDTINGRPVGVTYELQHDGSGRPYESILDLRRDKIRNFFDVANFDGVASFLPVQFEYVVRKGTRELIDEVEKITGLRAQCKRAPPQPPKSKELDPEFVRWMNEHVDWEVEKLVGYSRRDG